MNTHQPPDTKDHGRPLILKALEAELVGPEPLGMPLSQSGTQLRNVEGCQRPMARSGNG